MSVSVLLVPGLGPNIYRKPLLLSHSPLKKHMGKGLGKELIESPLNFLDLPVILYMYWRPFLNSQPQAPETLKAKKMFPVFGLPHLRGDLVFV